AQSILSRVLEDHPDNAQAHYGQAQVDLRRQRPAQAEKEFLAALKIGGEQPNIYYGLARAAAMQSDDDRALAYLTRVFAADDPLLRLAVRNDHVLTAKERTPELRRAVERYLTFATTSKETAAD
ncbi:MAG: tetratricopeptide repeat protein, partial [Acidobacteriota bacterium]